MKILIPLLLFLASLSADESWVQCDAGLYTVEFPAPPTKTEEKESMVTNVEYRTTKDDVSYVTSHFAIPKAAFAPFVGYTTESFAEKIFSEMVKRDPEFKKIDFKVSKKGKRQHLLEYSYVKTDGQTRDGAILISRSIFYQYSTTGPQNKLKDTSKHFADSFKLKEGFSIPRSNPS